MRLFLIMLVLVAVNSLPTLGEPINVKESMFLKVFPQEVDAFTLGRFIFYRSSDTSSKAHELVHVKQYKEKGVLVFLSSYYSQMLYGVVKGKTFNEAYYDISFEKEAYGKHP